jgi:hypothetical protein
VTGVATARSSQLKQMDAVQFTSSAMLIQRPHHSSAQTATVSKSQIVSNDPSDPDWRDRLESEETEWHTRPWLVRKVASTEAGVAGAGEGVDKDSEYSSHAMLVKDKHHTVDPGQIAEDAEVRSWTERNHSAVMAARRQMPQASHPPPSSSVPMGMGQSRVGEEHTQASTQYGVVAGGGSGAGGEGGAGGVDESGQIGLVRDRLKRVLVEEMRVRGLKGLDLDIEWGGDGREENVGTATVGHADVAAAHGTASSEVVWAMDEVSEDAKGKLNTLPTLPLTKARPIAHDATSEVSEDAKRKPQASDHAKRNHDEDSEYSSHAMLVKDKHHTVDPGQIAEDAEVRSWTERNHSAVMAARRQMPQASHSASRDPICQHLLYTHTQPSAHRTTSPPRKQGVPTAGSKSPPNKQASTPHPNSVALRPPTPSEPPSSPAMFMTHENMEKREARMEEERRAGLHMEQASASASTGQQGNVLHVGHGEEGERGQEEEERAETPESLMATSSSNSPVDNLPSAIEKEKGLPPKP